MEGWLTAIGSILTGLGAMGALITWLSSKWKKRRQARLVSDLVELGGEAWKALSTGGKIGKFIGDVINLVNQALSQHAETQKAPDQEVAIATVPEGGVHL